jgi:hypothetical protein
VPQNKLLGGNLSYAYGTPVPSSTDFLLLEHNQMAAYAIDDVNAITPEELIQNVYPTNRDFLYLVQEYENDVLTSEEVGIGEIQKTNSKSLLKRNYALRTYRGSTGYSMSGIPNVYFDQNFFKITPYIPRSYLNVLVYPNSILCSDYWGGPVGVDLPPSSVLGRLGENIQSLDSNELRSVLTDANITNAVESATGNYTFLCQTLNLSNSNSRLSSAALQARPVYNTSNRPTPQRGSIIYNDQTNRFEGYDGTAWQPFAWASGIGPPYV